MQDNTLDVTYKVGYRTKEILSIKIEVISHMRSFGVDDHVVIGKNFDLKTGEAIRRPVAPLGSVAYAPRSCSSPVSPAGDRRAGVEIDDAQLDAIEHLPAARPPCPAGASDRGGTRRRGRRTRSCRAGPHAARAGPRHGHHRVEAARTQRREVGRREARVARERGGLVGPTAEQRHPVRVRGTATCAPVPGAPR